ncbi:multi-sensor signal transduction histidine kinase [Crinalium epipsammum PCC 9333]|uniref:histidine kinase n=1 Tax=Crinalium epipsammum PCC 9333 TaxID=1173022 RepID=K9W2U6_9CYAN|nr:ATP-binding protein [Crinalium epipsammum]AFZ13755.1 multi-sensor signal transduction histidine kinase [Crinalium epipsammum PCC 9333]
MLKAANIIYKKGNNEQQHSALQLPRILSSFETWGFSVTGLLLWIAAAPAMNKELGSQAIFVWLPGVIVGILLNLQVKHFGSFWQEISGGTPNYTTRLLKNYPSLGKYAAIGYYISWVAVLPINAIILADLVNDNLAHFNLVYSPILLRVGFTIIAFVVAFSGTRALGILHLFFVVPAVGLILAFCLQGNFWLVFSSDSPGFLPKSWSNFNFVAWAKWFLFATYAVYSCETASSFVADSKKPRNTLQSLVFTACLIPIVYLGGSWLVMRLATAPELGNDTFLNLVAAAQPFWDGSAAFLVTFLIVSGCLLTCATAVANSPRVLYQLALDGHISPVFAITSRQGILAPGLVFTLIVSLLLLIWGNLSQIVAATSVGWLSSFIGLHWGLWLNRGRPEVRWAWLSLFFAICESVALIVGGLAWGGKYLLIGLFAPIAILGVDALLRRVKLKKIHPIWWIERYYPTSTVKHQDLVLVQVSILLLLLCGTTLITWIIRGKLEGVPGTVQANLLVVVLMTVAFVGVAIACWTSLPQVAAIAQLQEQTEQRFITAMETMPDTILVLNGKGIIRQANPAATSLFDIKLPHLVGLHLDKLLPSLPEDMEKWSRISEHTLQHAQVLRAVEMTFSDGVHRDTDEYVVILRDFTERKQAEIERTRLLLQEQAARAEAEAAQERITNTLESITDGFFALDKEWRVTYLNLQAEKILLRSREELLGKNIWSAFNYTGSLGEEFYIQAQKTVSENVVTHFEAFSPTYNMWLECHFYPSSEGMSSYFRNISDRKQAEADINKSLQQQQELTELKSSLITRMSHEFRTPLSIILSSTELIEHYSHRLSDEKKSTLFNQVTNSAKQITKLLDECLTINQAESQKIKFNPSLIELEKLIQELIAEIQSNTDNHKITFLGEGNCQSAVMDVNILRKSLNELLVNAIKYSPEGSEIQLKVTCENKKAVFQVKDQGIGIPASEQNHVFERFYRGSNVSNISGIGLGLSIVKKLVELHQGSIDVSSEIGVGSTFTVVIPL